MTEVINRSSVEHEDLFYDLGIEDNLPKTWEEFKKFIIGFSVEESIFTVEKFKEETWSKYIKRLQEWCKIYHVSEEMMLKKLRSDKIPVKFQRIFYALEVDIDKAIELIKEYEIFSMKNRQENKNSGYTRENNNLIKNMKVKKCYLCDKTGHLVFIAKKKKIIEKELICYKCGKPGHISRNCIDNISINNIGMQGE